MRVVFLKLPMRGGQRRLHGRLPDFHPRPAALRRHHLERRRPREHADYSYGMLLRPAGIPYEHVCTTCFSMHKGKFRPYIAPRSEVSWDPPIGFWRDPASPSHPCGGGAASSGSSIPHYAVARTIPSGGPSPASPDTPVGWVFPEPVLPGPTKVAEPARAWVRKLL